ncbi:uncharacterized protein YcbK (DUF882 family) [Natronobacillus azotifigens]|uniref:DUF2624 domain-containing protein n=1 Tax=Natronobacillus azotifigens TaxID=472978 RepID=A0A9J6RF84_9BACI|nr:DUF2624 domain-containing protein [Natronobacillus azotifigens]MCZ0704044.1 DUF2624 domain-containing protein [Natronobacillus azotifigens]
MQAFFQQMMMNKLNNLSTNELLHYATTYQIPISQKQANEIVQFLRTNKLNPTVESDRVRMFKQLEQITDKQTAQQAEMLFHQLIKQYGVEGWFK